MQALTVTSGLASNVFGQLQQQQAQRRAEQADSRAQALRSEAQAAQDEANQAEEKARALKTESSQASDNAQAARRHAVALKSLGESQAQLSDLRTQLAPVVASVQTAATATAQPFINADGQTTGLVVNTSA
jgi:predicted  nucleic acid-binding Zn-ribbon protein